MANHYTDHPELQFELHHPEMERIVALKERDFRDASDFDTAPLDFEDAMDTYQRTLDIVGEIAGTIIATKAAACAMRVALNEILMLWCKLGSMV